MKKFILIVGCIVLMCPIFSQDYSLLVQSAEKYYNEKLYDKAETLYEQLQNSYPDRFKGDRLVGKLKECQRAIEKSIFEKTATVAACDNYLAKYPNGMYADQVRSKKAALQAPKRPDAKDFVSVSSVYFGNVDRYGNTIDPYGTIMKAKEIDYLSQLVTYSGKPSKTGQPVDVMLYSKIIKPDGTLVTIPRSPKGFTDTCKLGVEYGENKVPFNACGAAFVSGVYTYELWSETALLYSAEFYLDEVYIPLRDGNWRNALKKCYNNYTSKADDDIYKGLTVSSRNTTPNGLGMYVWPNMRYIGNWNNGYMEGIGMIFFPEGKGVSCVKYCPKCAYYVGNFSRDKKSNMGRCYDNDGNMIYLGEFDSDSPVYKYPMYVSGSYKFESIEYSNGNYYVGETTNHIPDGYGIYIYNNGNMWYGYWEQGTANDSGLMMQYNGSVSESVWYAY